MPDRVWPRGAIVTVSLGLVLVVGVADYLTGHEILFSTFYLAAVALAAWSVGRVFAVVISVLSVGAWLLGDVYSGAAYSQPFVPVWNAAIILGFYLVVVWLLASLRGMQRELESRVRQRTVALTEEMAERARLEREILEIGEAERRRIGHDLHDSLGQLLTGTALATQVLGEKLSARGLTEAADAERIVGLVEEAVELTRGLSRGLHPVEVEAGGLAEALRVLAESTRARMNVDCGFHCEGPVQVPDAERAMHLYRIAQEAVNNAMKHGHARSIVIRLERTLDGVLLTIRDDGVGLPEPRLRGQGLGLRIMAYRASMIGAEFDIRRDGQGTVVTCELADP